jgi:hypothetical protein
MARENACIVFWLAGLLAIGFGAPPAAAVPIDQFVIYGVHGVVIGDGSKITGLVGAEHDDPVVGAAIKLNGQALIDGDARSSGDVNLQNGARIKGTLFRLTGTDLTLGTRASVGTDQVGNAALVGLPGLPIATAFTCGGANHTGANSQSLALGPGSYGDIQFGSRFTLTLNGSGNYLFNSITAASGARIVVPTPPVRIFVCGGVNFSGSVEVSFPNTPSPANTDLKVEVHASGENAFRAGGGSTWVGDVFAPFGEIHFGGGGCCSFFFARFWADSVDIEHSVEGTGTSTCVGDCIPGDCLVCDGTTINVDSKVTIDFNSGPPACSGDAFLCDPSVFSFDMSGPTPDTWMAIFNLGPKALRVKDGGSITTLGVPVSGGGVAGPGIKIISTCTLEVEKGGSIAVSSTNAPAGDIVLKIDGRITINGAVQSLNFGTSGSSGTITLASCCGDILTGPMSVIRVQGQQLCEDINILACSGGRCSGGDVEISGLVEIRCNGPHDPTINVVAFAGSVTIDGTNVVPQGKGSATTGLAIQAAQALELGKIRVQATDDITVLGNPKPAGKTSGLAALAVKTTSSGSVGGLIDVRSLSGKLNASNRAFDIANAGNDGAKINLDASGDVKLTVTAGQALPVATTRANKSKNQLIQVQSTGAGVLVGSQAQVLSPLGGKGASGNANLLTSCTGVTKQGTVDVPDLNLADDSGVCSAPPPPIFTGCSQFGIAF